MQGKKRIYFYDSVGKRILDMYIVSNNEAGGNLYMQYFRLYKDMATSVTWTENKKYLTDCGFK